MVLSARAVCLRCHRLVRPMGELLDIREAVSTRDSKTNWKDVSQTVESREFHWGGLRPVTRIKRVRRQMVVPFSLPNLIEVLNNTKC